MKMNIHANDIYRMTPDREKKLWSECIFIFDTSALLDFYLYTDAARKEIYSGIFDKLKNRLWIPSHVQFEYLKNRESKIEEPIKNYYNPLRDRAQGILDVFKIAAKNIDEIKKKTEKEDLHPHIGHAKIVKFERQLAAFIKQAESFNEKYSDQIASKEKEISDLKSKDTIFRKFSQYFEVGREYSFKEIMEITLEGKHRYEYEIPPGYKDREDKEGTQIFGDLVVWKQILEHSKKMGKDVVLISNDSKPDWCHIDKKRKRVISPRHELIKEMRDYSGVNFWMYNQEEFMYIAKQLLKSSITKTQIESVSKVIAEKNRNQYLILKCKNCGNVNKFAIDDLNPVFDVYDEAEERQMGPEVHYATIQYLNCKYCKDVIEARYDIWEYPIGAKDDQAITLDGADLINECDLDLNLVH